MSMDFRFRIGDILNESLTRRLDALSLLADPIRRRLFEFVRAEQSPVSRDAVSAATEVPRSLAAYHLDRLVDAGLLAAHFERPHGRTGPGAGRPAKLYSRMSGAITVSVPQRDYRLAALVLAEVVKRDASGAVRAAAMKVARETGAALASAGQEAEHEGRVPAPRIEDVLETLGYEPYLDDGRLLLRNCLFEDLVDVEKGLACGMNLALVDGALSATEREGRCARLDAAEGRCCVSIVPDGGGEVWDQLTADEQDELEERARLLVEAAYPGSPASGSQLEDITREVLERAIGSYASARVSNVCHEGAVEIFEDVVREQLP